MRLTDTEHDREILAVQMNNGYQLFEVSEGQEYQSSNHSTEIPVKWQIGYIDKETFRDRKENRYEEV